MAELAMAAAQVLLKVVVLAQALWAPKSQSCQVAAELSLLEKNLEQNMMALGGNQFIRRNTAAWALEALQQELRQAIKDGHKILGMGFVESHWDGNQIFSELRLLRERVMIFFQTTLFITTLEAAVESMAQRDEFQLALVQLQTLLRTHTGTSSSTFQKALRQQLQAVWKPLRAEVQAYPGMYLEGVISFAKATDAQTDVIREFFHAVMVEMEKERAKIDARPHQQPLLSTLAANPHKWYHDPITWEIMCDPVKGTDGRTYDRWTLLTYNITKSPFDPREDRPLKIAFDDIDVRSRLFAKFPQQEEKYRLLRMEYRRNALDKARQGLFVEALVRLNHVLSWAEEDPECISKRDEIQRLVSNYGDVPPGVDNVVRRMRDLSWRGLSTEGSQINHQFPFLNSINCNPRWMTVSSDQLAVKYLKPTKDDAVAVQANRPLSHQQMVSYFEMKVENKGTHDGSITIGFTSDTSFWPNHLPGLYWGSWGYHSLDGSWGCQAGGGQGPKFGTGDIVGAGILHSSQQIFFTHKGQLLGALDIANSLNGASQLFPTVGLKSRHAQVLLNFGHWSFTDELLPSYFHDTIGDSSLVAVSPDRLTARHVRKRRRNVREVVALQANLPAPCRTHLYYFEVSILCGGEDSAVGIGFTDKVHFEDDKQPGWAVNTCGYHGDDGMVHMHDILEPLGAMFSTGDTVGVGIHYGTNNLFFVKNGTVVGCVSNTLKGGLLFPTVAMESPNQEVKVNLEQDYSREKGQTTCTAMAATRRPELTEEKMARFKEAFRLVDIDGDGRITGKEVGSAMGVLGLDVTELEVQEMLSKGDLDGDGRLNFAEFLIILGWQLGPGELPNFTAQQLAPYKDAFTLYDKDGDGRITTQELEHAMKLLGHEMSQQEVQALVDAGDLDGNGSLDFAEFLILVDRLRLRQPHTGSGLSQQQMEEMEERYKEAFSVLDSNGDGRITALELGAAMQSMGYSPSEGEVREMLQAADADGDGTIDLAEFCTFVARLELEADAEGDGDAETEPDVEAEPDAEAERE